MIQCRMTYVSQTIMVEYRTDKAICLLKKKNMPANANTYRHVTPFSKWTLSFPQLIGFLSLLPMLLNLLEGYPLSFGNIPNTPNNANNRNGRI